VLNPSSESSSVKINALRPDNLTPHICYGAEAWVEGEDIQCKMTGVSYGVFKLD
jgi:hypothetical protein